MTIRSLIYTPLLSSMAEVTHTSMSLRCWRPPPQMSSGTVASCIAVHNYQLICIWFLTHTKRHVQLLKARSLVLQLAWLAAWASVAPVCMSQLSSI